MRKCISLKIPAAVSRIAFSALLFMSMAAATLHLGALTAQAAQADLSWSATTTYSDGSALTTLKGYKVYTGTTSGNFSQNVDVGNVTSYNLSNLNDGTTYYFAVTAYDTSGSASGFSNQVSYATPALPPPATLYTLAASAGSGGSITPSGSVVISKGTSQSYAIAPATGYKIAGVTVDGASAGAVSSYTFSNVAANHTIAATFASATASGTITSSGTWQNQAIASQSGTFTASFDMIPSATKINAITGFSAVQSKAYTDVAAVVRFNPTGTIDARNGSAFAAKVAMPYSAGKVYHVRMLINVPTHKYDVYVTAPGGAETQLAAGYAFRTEQAATTVLNNLVNYAGAGSHQLLNLSITSAPVVSAPITSSATWQNKSIASQSGAFTASFDMTPNANNINTVSGFSAIQSKAYADVAAVVRFNPTGTIDARNGNAYAAKVAVPYSAGKVYHVRMQINVATHKYDVYVTAPGGAETQLASGYAFRTEQATVTVLNNLSIFAGTGSHQLQNLSVTSP